MNEITITRPDDWHIHLRDGVALARTVEDASRMFARAIVMPNLKPPVTTTADALAYRERILAAVPQGHAFEPLMTLYLTDNTAPEEIRRAADSGIVHAVKLYPAGATTNSDSGVTDLAKVSGVLAEMERVGLPLLAHGEVTDGDIDIFDREAVFIERHLQPLTVDFPALKVVLEHITTTEAVEFVRSAPATVAATITAHHLLYNRNHMLAGGIRPHYYCLPILKRRHHQQKLLEAATSGESKFFLGTDSAPHARGAKESDCGCAGCYSAHNAIELYTEVFDRAGALGSLEGFTSFHGADFYGLERNRQRIRLVRKATDVPPSLAFGGDEVIPLAAGSRLEWRLADTSA